MDHREHPDEQAAKRRKVRRGTRSCWECRRRKAKCTFSAPTDAVCITCRRRGTKCVSQDVFLEDADSINVSPCSHHQHDNYLAPESNAAPRTGSRSASLTPFTGPAVSQTTTHVVHPQDQSPSYSRNTTEDLHTPTALSSAPTFAGNARIRETNRYWSITQALLLALPCRRDIEILVEKVQAASMIQYKSAYKTCGSTQKKDSELQASSVSLLYPNDHPVLLAGQILSLAAALRHFPRSEIISGLSQHHHVTMERLAESAIQNVTTNDSLMGTLEGVENIVLEGIYHIDGGNIRRAWITMRRAVVAAQLLGLHRPGHHRFKVIAHQEELDPDALWDCINHLERIISLLLGLPTSIAAANSPAQAASKASVDGADLTTLVMDATSRILERNEIQRPQDALELTREIDRQLIETTKQLPSTFWQPPTFASLDPRSDEACLQIHTVWRQMSYYSLINQLHLPYMLYASQPGQTVYSRMACVNASREVMIRAIAIRSFNPHTVCCRMGDFMALIAGMTLILAHLVSHCHGEMNNLLALQRSSDRAIVERALEGMKFTSEMCGDMLASRCAALLSQLLAIEADAAQDEGYQMHKPSMAGDGLEDNQNVLIVNVPYIGAIRIARKGISSVNASKIPHNQVLDEPITVGGIGSLHVNTPRTQDNEDATTSSGLTPGTESTQAPSATSSTLR